MGVLYDDGVQGCDDGPAERRLRWLQTRPMEVEAAVDNEKLIQWTPEPLSVRPSSESESTASKSSGSTTVPIATDLSNAADPLGL